jgi:hypothetical protein
MPTCLSRGMGYQSLWVQWIELKRDGVEEKLAMWASGPGCDGTVFVEVVKDVVREEERGERSVHEYHVPHYAPRRGH